MTLQVPAAISADALLGKSKAYVRKALLRKASKDFDEYQLWASLALELLAKSRLASIHPCLIADPTHSDSMFAAAGVNLSTDIKTITAKTLFERLKHVTPHFDARVTKFCLEIALRRNSELHSGDTPFKTMKLGVWESEYWYAAAVILKAQSRTLDDWLGTDQSDVPKRIAKLAEEAKAHAAKEKLKATAALFGRFSKADRERMLSESEKLEYYHHKDLFKLLAEPKWAQKCPSCGGKAYLTGFLVDESITNTSTDKHGAWEEVEGTYIAEEFSCPICKLSLEGAVELEAVGIVLEHFQVSKREMAYEPEYGND